MRIIDVVLESLESIANLDYPSDRYELIIVDNSSTDGSFEAIKNFLEKRSSLRKKIIRLNRNLGFTGGNNIGFRARDDSSRYVFLLNNDAVVEDHSVKLYVEIFEKYPRIGALQGVLINRNRRIIDSSGLYLSNMFTTHLFSRNIGDLPSRCEVLRCSFVEGTFPSYRVEALRISMGEKIFEDILFGYGEDLLTSLMIWFRGYSVAFIPKIVGFHMRGSTWSRVDSMYLSHRNYLAMANLFGGSIAYIYSLARTTIGFKCKKLLPILIKESKKLYNELEKKIGKRDITKTSVPIIKVPRRILVRGIITRRTIGRTIDIYVSKWIKKNISRLALYD
jgi:GT2 family glycosyltransferase